MTGDRNKLISFKERKDGTISFGNDGSLNVIRTGFVDLGSKDVSQPNQRFKIYNNSLGKWFHEEVFLTCINPPFMAFFIHVESLGIKL